MSFEREQHPKQFPVFSKAGLWNDKTSAAGPPQKQMRRWGKRRTRVPDSFPVRAGPRILIAVLLLGCASSVCEYGVACPRGGHCRPSTTHGPPMRPCPQLQTLSVHTDPAARLARCTEPDLGHASVSRVEKDHVRLGEPRGTRQHGDESVRDLHCLQHGVPPFLFTLRYADELAAVPQIARFARSVYQRNRRLLLRLDRKSTRL